jgi:uncharacterized protein (TIGR03437 family)
MTPHGIIQANDGNFYGVTEEGGAMKAGTVYKATPSGTLTVLFSFDITHGASPGRGVIQGTDGNLYGTSTAGGTAGGCMGFGCGTVYKITLSGSISTLYNFGGGSEGTGPLALIQANDGNFYGTTSTTSQTCSALCGTIFKLTPSGSLTTLHTFSGSDGSGPVDLFQASDGNLYGITGAGGAGTVCSGGCGTVFKITTSGALTTLYTFGESDFTDGWTPGSLIQGADGNLYGTTVNGGDTSVMEDDITSGVGTVFKITTSGQFSNLYKFSFNTGAFPAYLLQISDGSLYGSTGQGPANSACGCGTIYKITRAGALTTLYTLTGNSGGGLMTMVQATDGNIYGTANGGVSGDGTVFELTLGASSSTTPAISSGIVSGASFQPGISPGSWFTITGTNLSTVTDTWTNSIVNGELPLSLDGVTLAVSGVPAYIYYLSSTQINAIAPNVGPGTVQITISTPSGTSAPVTAVSQAEQPAFFQWGTYAVATTQTYALAVKNGTFSVTTAPAKPGDVIILWGTGFGPTNPLAPVGALTPTGTTYNTANPVTVTVGGMPATVYGAALAPGYAGLYQVAIQIPASLQNGDYPVIATIDGASSPSTTLITVQQ